MVAVNFIARLREDPVARTVTPFNVYTYECSRSCPVQHLLAFKYTQIHTSSHSYSPVICIPHAFTLLSPLLAAGSESLGKGQRTLICF